MCLYQYCDSKEFNYIFVGDLFGTEAGVGVAGSASASIHFSMQQNILMTLLIVKEDGQLNRIASPNALKMCTKNINLQYNQSPCRDWKLYWSVLVYLLTNILVTEGYQLIMNAE